MKVLVSREFGEKAFRELYQKYDEMAAKLNRNPRVAPSQVAEIALMADLFKRRSEQMSDWPEHYVFVKQSHYAMMEQLGLSFSFDSEGGENG